MDTLLKNRRTGIRRWVAYNRQYISITRDSGTRYYKYSARRIYTLLAIKASYEISNSM